MGWLMAVWLPVAVMLVQNIVLRFVPPLHNRPQERTINSVVNYHLVYSLVLTTCNILSLLASVGRGASLGEFGWPSASSCSSAGVVSVGGCGGRGAGVGRSGCPFRVIRGSSFCRRFFVRRPHGASLRR